MSSLQHFISIHSVIKYAGMFAPVANMQEAISLVIRSHIKAEIIGRWLYCFTSPLVGFQLEKIGFWYSYKFHAYVYTGTKKETLETGETPEEIRVRLGCWEVKEGVNV